jgi:hypothetical protein
VGVSVSQARAELIALLTNPERRAALRRGELPRMFDTIDTAQLERTAQKIQRDTLRRRRRGAPPLVEQFAATLANESIDPIATAFIHSEHYAAYREVPSGPPGLCIEEAFYRFLDAHEIGPAQMRRVEYLRAAGQALVVHPRPAFTIPRPFVFTAGAWVAFAEGPTMFAALPGRFVQGRVPRVVVDALAGRAVPEAARSRLAALGFSFDDGACPSRTSPSI